MKILVSHFIQQALLIKIYIVTLRYIYTQRKCLFVKAHVFPINYKEVPVTVISYIPLKISEHSVKINTEIA